MELIIVSEPKIDNVCNVKIAFPCKILSVYIYKNVLCAF